MQSEYLIYLGSNTIGKAQVQRQGLYYRILCKCSLQGNVMHNIWITCGDNEINLGLCAPEGDCFTLRKCIPIKQVGEGQLAFCVRPRHESVAGRFVPLRADEPFAYLEKLRGAVLEKRGDIQGIVIPENSD